MGRQDHVVRTRSARPLVSLTTPRVGRYVTVKDTHGTFTNAFFVMMLIAVPYGGCS